MNPEISTEHSSEILFWHLWDGFKINGLKAWEWRELAEVRGEVKADLKFPVWGFRVRRTFPNWDGFSRVSHGTIENAGEFPHLRVYGQDSFRFELNLVRFRYQFLQKRTGEGEYPCFEFSSESLAKREGIVSCQLSVEAAKLCALQVLGISPYQARGIKVETIDMNQELTGKSLEEKPNGIGFVFQASGIEERSERTVVVDVDGTAYLRASDSKGLLLERLRKEIFAN